MTNHFVVTRSGSWGGPAGYRIGCPVCACPQRTRSGAGAGTGYGRCSAGGGSGRGGGRGGGGHGRGGHGRGGHGRGGHEAAGEDGANNAQAAIGSSLLDFHLPGTQPGGLSTTLADSTVRAAMSIIFAYR